MGTDRKIKDKEIETATHGMRKKKIKDQLKKTWSICNMKGTKECVAKKGGEKLDLKG